MISSKVIADSVSPQGVRLTTMEIEVPRIVWAEFMTHRMFSRNAASSRAIPFNKMKEQLKGRPVRFGASNVGMQDKGDNLDVLVADKYTPNEWWEHAKNSAIMYAEGLHNAGLHKQTLNRLTEPFQVMKAVVSATEWNNFFWLRDDVAADPTLQELAKTMKVAYADSTPQLLKAGQWHLPYVDTLISSDGEEALYYENKTLIGTVGHITLDDAIKVSGARCAAVSYRNVDYDLDKSKQVYARLVESQKIHGSALEHQATPIKSTNSLKDEFVNNTWYPHTWEDGITHMDKNWDLWSGNFKGFIQARKLIAGENHSEG